MSTVISVPLWLMLALALLAAIGLWFGAIAPTLRRAFYRRRERALQRLEEKLAFGPSTYGLAKRSEWLDRLLTDADVVAQIEALATETTEPVDSIRLRARGYIADIVPFFDALLYFRLGYWLARWMLRTMYWIRADYASRQALADIGRDCCVVVVSNHRSNIDPFLMIYLASKRSAISYSAGEWALGWPFRYLLHAIGFYIIRRNAYEDPLYRTLAQRFVFLAASHCVPQGLFLEGGLSRDGSMQPLKLGLLGYMSSALGKGSCRDIVFVPVGLSYDRIPEDRTLIEHRDKGFGDKGVGYSFLAFARFMVLMMPKMVGLSKPFGQAVANFGEPLSLLGWSMEGTPEESVPGSHRGKEQLAKLGDELRERIIRLIPVLPIALLSDILLQTGESGISELQVKKLAMNQALRLKRAGVAVVLTENQEDHELTQALHQLLRRRLIVVAGSGCLCIAPGGSGLLCYHRNAIPSELRFP